MPDTVKLSELKSVKEQVTDLKIEFGTMLNAHLQAQQMFLADIGVWGDRVLRLAEEQNETKIITN